MEGAGSGIIYNRTTKVFEREGQQQVLRVYFGGIYVDVKQLLSPKLSD